MRHQHWYEFPTHNDRLHEWIHNDNLIQVHIPLRKPSSSFITKIKCQVTSNTTHDVLISKAIRYKSYKEICSGEPKKVNLGYNNDVYHQVVNNTLQHYPPIDITHGWASQVVNNWEVLSMFFSIYNIEPNWSNCNFTWGWYDEELGGWTGCMGQVWGTESRMYCLKQIFRLRGMRLILPLMEATHVSNQGER